MTKTRTLLTAALLAATIGAAHAQTAPLAKPNDPHHPAGAAAPATPAPAAGMAMGGDMGKMMESMMPMMRMMMARGDMMRMDGPMGMMAPERIEGRIAFLRTELKINEAQQPQWAAFAETLRGNAKATMETRKTMMQPKPQLSAPDSAEHEVHMLSARLEGLKATATATRALYAILTDPQKKAADELLMPAMGRM